MSILMLRKPSFWEAILYTYNVSGEYGIQYLSENWLADSVLYKSDLEAIAGDIQRSLTEYRAENEKLETNDDNL